MAEVNLAVRLDAMQLPLRRALEMASRFGASAVELDARNEIHPSQLSDTGLRQLRKILEDMNLRVAALRFQTRRGYDNPQDLDRRVDATKAAMQLAYRLGAPVVINAIGAVPPSEDDRWSSLQTALDDLGRYGAKVGAFLAAETGAEIRCLAAHAGVRVAVVGAAVAIERARVAVGDALASARAVDAA